MQCDHRIDIKHIDTAPRAVPTNAEIAALVKHDRVHTSLYTSDELFQLELDRVFSKTWVWVAHASEIPETPVTLFTFPPHFSVRLPELAG
jgi:hypothetical protein